MFNNIYNVKKVEFLYFNPSSSSRTITTKLQCYDGVNWIDIPNTIYTHNYTGGENKNFIYEINDLNIYGIRVYATSSASFTISLREMQIYGYE